MNRRTVLGPWLVVAVVGLSALAAYILHPEVRATLDRLQLVIGSGGERLREYIRSFGAWAPVASFFLMLFQSLVVPLPAYTIAFANGILFGVPWGILLSWTSAMAAAALCFGIARGLGRPWTERIVGKGGLKRADRFFLRFGGYAVFICRLIPLVSFDAVSYGAGLTGMRFWPFWLATGAGMLPATTVYTLLGERSSGAINYLYWGSAIVLIALALLAGYRRMRPRGED